MDLPAEVQKDPFSTFGAWFAAAQKANLHLPEACSWATVNQDGQPSNRMVLLKQWGPEGFVVFTNYGSQKAQDLLANPRCALTFHWSILERQIRILGRAEKISSVESIAYFATRPRDSQVGAWASHQSQVIPSLDMLAASVTDYESRFSNGEPIPCPPDWGGYRIVPHSIEFWIGRASRLHDRVLFEKNPGNAKNADNLWLISLLSP